MATDRKYRVQLDFSAEALRELEDLQKRIAASTRAETIRNALTVLRWVVDKREQGYDIVALGKDAHIVEPVFGFLSRQSMVPGDTVADRVTRLAHAVAEASR
jgi:hypothetical protein